MSHAARAFRFLTIHLLIVSIGAVGLMPVLMLGEESSRAEQGRSPASMQRCCCGTAGGACCGMSCCGMQKSGERQCPARSGNDNSGLTLLAIGLSCPDMTVATGGACLTRLAATLCQPPSTTLQAMHVRLDA